MLFVKLQIFKIYKKSTYLKKNIFKNYTKKDKNKQLINLDY